MRGESRRFSGFRLLMFTCRGATRSVDQVVVRHVTGRQARQFDFEKVLEVVRVEQPRHDIQRMERELALAGDLELFAEGFELDDGEVAVDPAVV